jgi:hypothetical protein
MTSLILDAETPAGPAPRITAARIKTLYDDGTKAIKHQQLIYQENAAYIEGEQHVYRHSTRQELLQLPRNPKKVRVTIPRLGPESRRIFSKLLRRPLVFEVTPDSADDAAIRGAAVAQGVLSSLAKTQKWEKLREELAWTMWKGGTGLLCVDWDKTAGRSVMADGTEAEGDVKISCLAITEVATEPGTRDIERAGWWIKAIAIPPGEAKVQYGLRTQPQTNTAATLSPSQMRIARQNTGQTPLNLTLVLTYYERPSKDNPKGTIATVIGDEIVDGPHDWHFPFKDRLNVICVRETMVEGRWTGHTIVTDAVPVQTALNHATTCILEHLKQAGNARLQNNSGERINAENLTDEAGEYIFHDGEELWSWMSPPQMPDWWQRVPDMLKQDMDDIIGIHDVSRGDAPTNIESGLGLSILAEQDDTPTGKMSQTLADAFTDLATMILQTYERMVPVNSARTATIAEPHQIPEKVQWDGSSFAGQTDARVPYDAVAPLNEAARFARGMAFLDRKIITSARQLSRYIDLPGGTNFIETTDSNVAKARRENYQLALGEPMVPADFDNHSTHVEEHNDFRLTARYERLDDPVREQFDMHLQAHTMLAAEEAAMQTARMAMAPGLAMAANQRAMPGSGTLEAPPGFPGGPGQPSQGGPQQGGPQPVDETAGAEMGGNPEESMSQEQMMDPMGGM